MRCVCSITLDDSPYHLLGLWAGGWPGLNHSESGDWSGLNQIAGTPLKLRLGGDFDCKAYQPSPVFLCVLCAKRFSLSPKKLESVLVPTILQNAGKAKSE